MTKSEIIQLSHNKYISSQIQYAIEDAILAGNYEGTKWYEVEDYIKKVKEWNFSKRKVYMLRNEKWVWSWINSINTNNSCWYVIFKFLNKKYKNIFTEDAFINDPISLCKMFKKCLIESTNDLFIPGSEEFKEMFFITQQTWALGNISTISIIYTLKKHHKPIRDYYIDFERGDVKDMNEGIDMTSVYTGLSENMEIIKINETYQNKRCNNGLLEEDGDYYWWKYIKYKPTYDNVSYFVIDDNEFIYLYKNSLDREKIGMGVHPRYKETFRVHKTLLIMKVKKEGSNITDLLVKINQHCFDQKIIFYFEQDDSKLNKIIHTKDTIRIILNDPNDENLEKTLLEFIESL